MRAFVFARTIKDVVVVVVVSSLDGGECENKRALVRHFIDCMLS